MGDINSILVCRTLFQNKVPSRCASYATQSANKFLHYQQPLRNFLPNMSGYYGITRASQLNAIKFDTLRCRREKNRTCCPDVYTRFQALKNWRHLILIFRIAISLISLILAYFYGLFHDFIWFFRVSSVGGGGGVEGSTSPHTHPRSLRPRVHSMWTLRRRYAEYFRTPRQDYANIEYGGLVKSIKSGFVNSASDYSIHSSAQAAPIIRQSLFGAIRRAHRYRQAFTVWRSYADTLTIFASPRRRSPAWSTWNAHWATTQNG